MKVKNINGTSDNTCKCESWLKHWENYGGGKAGLCVVTSCVKKAEVGAHVQKANSTDNRWYIVPFCKDHNALTGKEIDISDSTKLVSANTKETCAK